MPRFMLVVLLSLCSACAALAQIGNNEWADRANRFRLKPVANGTLATQADVSAINSEHSSLYPNQYLDRDRGMVARLHGLRVSVHPCGSDSQALLRVAVR
jgi:hypothetical protein